MNSLQVWLLVAVPTLVLTLALLLRPTPARTLSGYLVLTAGFGVTAASDRVTAAVLGGLLALLFAAGDRLAGAPRRPDEQGVPDAALHPKRRAGPASERAQGGR